MWPGGVQLLQHLEPVTVGQTEVEQHHIPPLTEGQRHRFGGRACLAELHAIGQALHELDQSTAHQRVIVHDENANHRSGRLWPWGAGGNHAATRVPPPERGATSNTPPSTAARSRIPKIPSERGPVVPASVIPPPSSLTSRVTQSLFTPSSMFTRVAPAWRDTFVSASCTMRNSAVASSSLFRIVQEALTDRKSTRLNSSHSQISYAVFCLKKKKKKC